MLIFRMPMALLAILFLTSCATAPSCYVGVTFPIPVPVIMCGADISPSDDEEDPDV
jgi:hypothetical protein